MEEPSKKNFSKEETIQSSVNELDMDNLFDLSDWESEEIPSTRAGQPNEMALSSGELCASASISPQLNDGRVNGNRARESQAKGQAVGSSMLELPTMGNSLTAVAVAEAPKAKDDQQAQKTKSPAKTSTSKRFSPLKLALGLTFNLLGLGVSGVLATLGGAAIAHFFYSPTVQEPPLLEEALEQSSRTLSLVRNLPTTVTQVVSDRLEPPVKPRLDPAAPILTNGQRQQIANEVAALQGEFAQMKARASALEDQLGYEYSEALMGLRLEALAQTVADPQAGPLSVANRDRDRQPLLVTLPIDPLFEDGQSNLKPASTALLGAILTELRSYPEGVVTIGAHTDDVGAGVANRDLSLRRAQSVARYLQVQVGDSPEKLSSNRFLWSMVGYGNAQPLAANEGDENRQRNRRLEIQVAPR